MNLGQPRIETQDAARIQLGEFLNGIQVEKRNTAIEVMYELPMTTELVKKRDSSENAAPLQYRQACTVGSVVTLQSQRLRQPDTKQIERYLRAGSVRRFHPFPGLVVVPNTSPTVQCVYFFDAYDLVVQPFVDKPAFRELQVHS